MKTTKDNKKNKNWSSALVISIMCAVIMTIVWQSLHNSTDTYAWTSFHNENIFWQMHEVAPISWLAQWSRNILDGIVWLIIDQKQWIYQYMKKTQATQNIINSWHISLSNYTWIQSNTLSWSMTAKNLEYQLFETIKKQLSEKNCSYTLPIDIDNNDVNLLSHIKWWLQHCIITVSYMKKVYPNDILTHKMMRLMAQRIWFSVKMEYASDQAVTREQLLNFFYALQQHHKIGDLPVVWMSTPVQRIEYITLLHKMFGDDKEIDSTMIWSWKDAIPKSLFMQSKENTWTYMTVKELKQILIQQGQKLEITPYDDSIIATSDITKKMLSSYTDWNQKNSVWIDKEMIKQTMSRLVEKI
jgi:hypothetical protein